MPLNPKFWWIVATVLIVIPVLLILGLNSTFGIFATPAGERTVGDFRVRDWRREGFGHSLRESDLFYKERSLVRRRLAGFYVVPYDSQRALYTAYCRSEHPDSECGLFYWDGHSGKIHRISDSTRVSFSSLGGDSPEGTRPWSPDGRFWVISQEDSYDMLIQTGPHYWLLDLETGKATNLASSLGDGWCRERPVKGWSTCREIWFAGWAPDSSRGALLVNDTANPMPPDTKFTTELYTFDPMGATVDHICTSGVWELAQPNSPRVMRYDWQQEGGQYKFQLSFRGNVQCN